MNITSRATFPLFSFPVVFYIIYTPEEKMKPYRGHTDAGVPDEGEEPGEAGNGGPHNAVRISVPGFMNCLRHT